MDRHSALAILGVLFAAGIAFPVGLSMGGQTTWDCVGGEATQHATLHTPSNNTSVSVEVVVPEDNRDYRNVDLRVDPPDEKWYTLVVDTGGLVFEKWVYNDTTASMPRGENRFWLWHNGSVVANGTVTACARETSSVDVPTTPGEIDDEVFDPLDDVVDIIVETAEAVTGHELSQGGE